MMLELEKNTLCLTSDTLHPAKALNTSIHKHEIYQMLDNRQKLLFITLFPRFKYLGHFLSFAVAFFLSKPWLIWTLINAENNTPRLLS